MFMLMLGFCGATFLFASSEPILSIKIPMTVAISRPSLNDASPLLIFFWRIAESCSIWFQVNATHLRATSARACTRSAESSAGSGLSSQRPIVFGTTPISLDILLADQPRA